MYVPPTRLCLSRAGFNGSYCIEGPVDPSFRALFRRLQSTVRRHKINKDSLSSKLGRGGVAREDIDGGILEGQCRHVRDLGLQICHARRLC